MRGFDYIFFYIYVLDNLTLMDFKQKLKTLYTVKPCDEGMHDVN